MSLSYPANPATEETKEHKPTTYTILANAYARITAIPKSDQDLYMLIQKRALLDEYESYRMIGKLIKAIAMPIKVREFYRFIAPPPLPPVAKAYQAYADNVKMHFKDPDHFPMPAPFTLPKPQEGHWELVIETDSRMQDHALELLRQRWMDNPLATAQKIVEVLADWPIYRTNDDKYRSPGDDNQYRIEVIKPILRQAQRLLLTQIPAAPDWKAIDKAAKEQKKPSSKRPEMPQVAMTPKDASPFSVSVPSNLTLLETEFDLYQRHQTCVYVAGDDGKLVGLNLPLDNDFARLRSTNRNRYNADKYNSRYEAQLLAEEDANSPIRRSLRFLARQVAEGRKVKIVTDKNAAHGHMVVQAVAALVPAEAAQLHKANPTAGRSGYHNMDDRDYIDEYDRPARHVWTVPNLEFCYWKLRKHTLGSAHGPIPVPDLRATKKDAADIKWWNLYWMPRRYMAYLVYSVRRFTDRNGIKKHVVIYQPVKVEMGDKIVRKQKAAWLIVEEDDLRQLCHSEQKITQYDWDGNVIGYSNYRQAPATFKGELPEKFTTLLIPEQLKTLKREEIKPVREWGRVIGYTLKPQPWDYNSKMRNTFAWVLATVRSSKPFQRAMDTISRWEYEKDHEFEHRTVKTAIKGFKRQDGDRSIYYDSEEARSHGRFADHDNVLNPTYEEFAEATMYAEGARDGLDLLADGEISLATAAELATIASKPTRKAQEMMVEEILDKKLQELREKDQKKADLRRAEELIEILAMLKRHPELEAHISRELNPEGRICKIWNIDPKANGYVHTPISQMFHLHPILVRKDGVTLTPEQQAALPENEGRRYIAAEWEARAPEALFMSRPNLFKDLAVRNGKRIYERKLNYGQLKLRFLQPHSGPDRSVLRKAA
jgi:hypothetical protein